LSHVKVTTKKYFGCYFVMNQKQVVKGNFINAYKTHITKGTRSFKVVGMTYFGQGVGHIFSMMI
jgi:hypothetical protein